MATSYNGWAASPSPSAIGIDTNWSVLGTRPFASGGFPGGVKSGPVAIVFRHLVTRLNNEVEPMMTDPVTGKVGYGCWGYSYRANVNNPSVLSCHASGTAIDYNAPRHPNGTSVGPNGGGGWTREQAAKIRAILADLGGVVRWLSGNDPMHFEINGSEQAVALAASRLGDPGKQPPPKEWDEMATRDEVKAAAAEGAREAVNAILGQLARIADDAAWVRNHNQEDSFNGTADALHQPEFVGWQQVTRHAATVTAQIAEKLGVNVPPPVVPPPVPTYTVVAGDTLSRIAAKFGVTIADLVAWNGLADPNTIAVGQVLKVSAPKA